MKQKQRASGLIFAVIMLFVVLAMVVTLSSVTVLETKMGSKTKSSVGAFYNSEAGVEWTLNRITTSSGTGTINSVFSGRWDNTNHYVSCPSSDCNVYLLDDTGQIIQDSSKDISEVKAVRSVGTNDVAGTADTQRAIEAAVASTDFPNGGIIMWSGTLASIPTGWVLCDGTNGTPDLRSRFVYGAPDGTNPGSSGTVTTSDTTPTGTGGRIYPPLYDPSSAGYYTVAFLMKK